MSAPRRRALAPSPAAWAAAGLLLAVGGWLAASGPGPAARGRSAGGSASAPWVEGELLVRFRDDAPEGERAGLRSGLGARRVRGLGRSLEQLRLRETATTEAALERLRRDPRVEYAEPNYLWRPDLLPDDLRFVELYGLRNTGQTGGTPGADIDAEAAWDVTTGTHDVVVGVIDSGIDYRHPDLSANIWTNPGEIPANGVDDDGNGYVDDVHGWDFANDDDDPSDDVGHGTHVAGTIGAVGDNGLGVTGVAWKVRLVPLKFIGADGFGTTADAVAAVRYATAIGADLTNNSWGGGAFSRALLEAIEEAAAAGVVFVASAGNSGVNTDSLPHFPSSYEVENVISVAAVNHDDVRPLFSNFGPRTVDLGAPGVNVLSTRPGGTYGFLSGTSMAAPHVSGAAALVRAEAPWIGPAELRALLLASVDPVPSLSQLTVSRGRLNVRAALADRDRVPPGAITDLRAEAPSSSSVRLGWTATGDDGEQGTAAAYDLRRAPWPIDASSFQRATRVGGLPRAAPAGTAESFEVCGLEPGTRHHFALRAIDEWGNAGPVSNLAFETTLPAPTLTSDPAAFDVELYAGQGASRTLTVANAGAGTLDWMAAADVEWIDIAPAAGRLLGGESVELTLGLTTRGLAAGRLEARVELASNDPLRPRVVHPLALDLLGAAAIEVVPAALDFGEVFVGASAARALEVANFGTEPLAVADIASSAAGIDVVPRAVDVPPGESRAVTLGFTPASAGALQGTLVLRSDAPNAPELEVALRGTGAPPPAIAVEPTALSETLLSGTTVTRALRLRNDGASPLVADFRFEPGANPGQPPVSPLVNGGFETGDFAGWSARKNDVAELAPWTVGEAGGGWFRNGAPVEGRFDAWNGFEGGAGLAYDLEQELVIPPGVTHARLSWLDRIQWDDLGSASTVGRVYRATIEDPARNVLVEVAREEILFDGSGYTDRGWQPRTVDLLPYAGQTVRLHLRQLVREALTGPGQIEFDAFELDLAGFPDWFRPRPIKVVVPPGGEREVEVIFDARGLLAADLDASIRIETNVPDVPTWRVPVALRVFGLPDLAVHGADVVVESSRAYATAGARTEHALPIAVPPETGGTVELVAIGDLGDVGEGATLWLEGRAIGAMGNLGADCVETARSWTLSAEELAALAADGMVEAAVQNTIAVAPVCSADRHVVRLRYEAPAGRLDFGAVRVGESAARSLRLDNPGTAPLHVAAEAIAPAGVSVVPAALTVGVGESADVEVAFAPAVAGPLAGTLRLASDDPDSPLVEVALLGAAIDPPRPLIEPESIAERLPVGGRAVLALSLTNAGDEALAFTASPSGGAADFVAVRPAAGVLPPDEATPIEVTIDAGGLAPGPHATTILVDGGAMAGAPLEVPVRLTVEDAPQVVVRGRAVEVASSADYSGSGAVTRHRLAVAAAASRGATLRLIAVGDFGDPGETATVHVEGETVGSLGGEGADCLPAQRDLAIDAERWAAWIADGEVVVEVRNAEAVADFCAANFHALRLIYDESIDPLAFGRVLVGRTAERLLVVENAGTRALEIESVMATDPAFSMPVAALALPPGGSHALAVAFAPPIAGSFEAALELRVDDPDDPIVRVQLRGTAEEPPRIEVAPRSLEVELEAGLTASLALLVSNTGRGALRAAATVVPPTADFVRLGAVPAVVPAGGAAPIEVTIDARSLFAGPREATIVVEGDDPVEPRIEIPLRLVVTGTPRLVLSPAAIEFVPTPVGARRAAALDLVNQGTATLHLGAIETDPDAFDVEPGSLDLAPGEARTLVVAFRPPSVGPLGGSLTLRADAGEPPLHVVPLEGSGIAPARATVAPASLEAVLDAGSTETLPLDLANDGASPLAFLARVVALDATAGAPAAGAPEPRARPLAPAPEALTCLVADPWRGHLYGRTRGAAGFWRYDAATDAWERLLDAPFAASGSCGAALYGKRIWTAQPAGSAALAVFDLETARWSSVPAPLPGAAALAADGAGRLYQVLGPVGRAIDAASGAVRPIAAPPVAFAADGSLVGLDGRIFGRPGGSADTTLVVYDPQADRWDTLPPLPGPALPGLAADPLLRALYAVEPGGAGATLHRLAPEEGAWRSAPVAVDAAGGAGGPVWLGDPWAGVHLCGGAEGRALSRIETAPAWVRVAPNSGRVEPGRSTPLQVALDATALHAGLYRGTIEIATDDPAAPRVAVPLRFEVRGAPELRVDPPRLDFGDVFVALPVERRLTVDNAGRAALRVSSVSTGLAGVTLEPSSFDLSPGGSETVVVRLAAATAQALDGELVIASDDPARPSVAVALTARASHPPLAAIAPASLDTATLEGRRVERTLTVSNLGRGRLDFALEVVADGEALVTLSLPGGSLDAGGAVDVAVVFDPGSAAIGTYPARIVVTTNDPLRPAVDVPATLNVLGAPDLAVGGAEVALESTRPFSGAGTSTHHAFADVVPPAGSGRLELVVEGDFGNPGELATVSAEGREWGQAGASGADCSTATTEVFVTAEELAAVAADGSIALEVRNSADVRAFCPANRHTVRLRYYGSAERLDFGKVFLGTRRSLALVLENLGRATLEIAPPASDAAEFVPAAAALSVPPGETRTVAVSFVPSGLGEVQGRLTLATNDPDAPRVRIALSGEGAHAPRLVLDPPALDASVAEGGSTVAGLRLVNTGAGPLEFVLAVEAGAASFVSPSTTAGTVPAAGETSIAVALDASRLVPGAHDAAIEVITNDPLSPSTIVPLTLRVLAAPHLTFAGETITLESVVEFDAAGALTRHALPVTIPPAGAGEIEVVGDGDFGGASEYAVVTAEGRAIGSLGAVGPDCVPAFETFPLDADTLAALVDDSVVSVEVQNNPTVDPLCPRNAHTVRVRYVARRERLDFGTVFVGRTATRATTLINAGSLPLQVGPVATDAEGFVAAPQRLTLDPGESATVAVTFAPTSPGPAAGRLVIPSDDPDAPLLEIPLRALAADPPRLELAPTAIEATLREGERGTRTLSLANAGASPLDVAIGRVAAEGHLGDWTLFGNDGGGGNLYTIDPSTGVATFVGFTGVAAPSLAFDPASGVLYAGGGGGLAALYTVDPASASVSYVGDTGLGALVALDFAPGGALYAAAILRDGPGTGGDTLAIVDTRDGEGRPVGEFGGGIGTIGGPPGIAGLAFHPTTGTLYGASGEQVLTVGDPSLYVVDAVTGQASPVGPIVDAEGRPVPGGVGSLQFDPDGVLYGGTGRGTGNLIRIDPQTAVYTLVGRSVPSALGGLALRRDPPDLSWLDVAPAAATLAPAERLDVEVSLDTLALAPGSFDARLAVVTNDPERSAVSVPLRLTVLGVPDIAVPGETVVAESTREFTGQGGATSHELTFAGPAAGGATLELIAEGDFGSANEVARLIAEGLALGSVGNTGSDCFPASDGFVLSAGDLAQLAADGTIGLEVVNAPTVAAFCVFNRHTVRLTYDRPRRTIDFGTVYVGHPGVVPLRVENAGRAALRVTSIAVDDPTVSLDAQALTIPPLGAATLHARFAPERQGSLAAMLRLECDDPDEPRVEIAVVGRALGAPRVRVEPASVEAALPPHAARPAQASLRVSNDGESELAWSAELYESFARSGPVPVWTDLPKGDGSADGAGATAAETSGGPDAFGYRFLDNARPGGPVFDWIDLGVEGTVLDLHGDDALSQALPIGFAFPFYGDTFEHVFVGSNGTLGFSGDRPGFSNPASLPAAGSSVPGNLVAPFWDDLVVATGEVRYLAGPDRFVVQYHGVGRFASAAELTFQVVLHRSGKIVFQYLNMIGRLDSATIGIQNGDRTVGLLVAYNRDYVRDGLAVEIAPLAPWVSSAPASGVLPPGTSAVVSFELSSAGLDAADLAAEWLLRTNDPAREETLVPVALHVGTLPLESFEIRPSTLNRSTRGRAIHAVLELPAGHDPREVLVETVRLLGEIPAETSSAAFADEDGDGLEELILRFDRREVLARLGDGESVEVTIGGAVAGRAWFEGSTPVRVRSRP